jgi:hypothetical protein
MGRTGTDRQFQTNIVTVSDPPWPWNYSIEHNQAEHSFFILVSGAEPLTGYLSFVKMKSSNIYFLFKIGIGITQENVLNKINRSVINCLTVEVEKIQAIFVEIVKK